MSFVSPLNAPVNVNICSTAGTIFSSPSGGSGGSGTSYTFSNVGGGAGQVYSGIVGNNVQFRTFVQGNNTVLSQIGSTLRIDVNDLLFSSLNPITRNIPGLLGVVLGGKTVLQALTALLYPTVPPSGSISVSPALFEYGNTQTISAPWNAIIQTNPILTISVNAVPISPITGNNQSGTASISNTGTASLVIPLSITDNKGNTTVISATATVGRKIRFGGQTKDGIIAPVLDSDANGLTNQVFSTVSQLSQSPVILNSNYLLITIPNSLLNGYTPIFKLNGFVGNAFNLVRNNAFVNSFGFSEPTTMWVSTTILTGTFQLEID